MSNKTLRSRLRKAGTSVAIILGTLATGQVEALEPEDLLYHRVGNVSIRPSFGLAGTYNDNIFFRGDESFILVDPNGNVQLIEKESDFITTLSPGTSITLGRPTGNFINTSYDYSHRLYADHAAQNAGNHSLLLNGKLDGSRINLVPSLRFNNTRSVLSGATRRIGTGEELIERSSISASLSAKIRMTPKLFTQSKGNYSLNSWQSNLPFFDTEALGFSQSFGFQIREKISLAGYGSIGRTTATPNNATIGTTADQNYIGGGLSAEGEFSDRLTGEIRFGVRRASFSQGGDSFVAPVAGVTLDYLLWRDISTSISYTRQTFVGVQTANASGVSDRFSISARKPFGTRKNWAILATGNFNFQSWENQTGLSAGRSDDWLSGRIAVQYQIQEWLSSSLAYNLQTFSSSLAKAGTFGIVDYDVNTVSLSVRIGY